MPCIHCGKLTPLPSQDFPVCGACRTLYTGVGRRSTQPRVPKEICQRIIDSFPTQYEALLKAMQWSFIDGCWYFKVHGMTVGVEIDGYIHS